MKNKIFLLAFAICLSGGVSASAVGDAGELASVNKEVLAPVSDGVSLNYTAPEFAVGDLIILEAQSISYAKTINIEARTSAKAAPLFELIDPGRLCDYAGAHLSYLVNESINYKAPLIRPPVVDQIHLKRPRLPSVHVVLV